MRIIGGFGLRQVMGQATIIGEGIGQIDFNKPVTLNTTVAYLWQSVEGKVFSIGDLTVLLTEHFHIDPAITQRNAFVIARKWITIGIVQEQTNEQRTTNISGIAACLIMECTCRRSIVFRSDRLGNYFYTCCPANCIGVCGYRNRDAALLLLPPVSVAKGLRDVTTVAIRSHAPLNRTLVVAVKLLRQNGIHPVLLKGQGVATNYIAPYLRMCGDIDLYIGQRDYDKVCEVVRQRTGTKEGIGGEKHYHFKHGDVTVKLYLIAERLVLPCQNTRFQHWTHKHLHNDHLCNVEIESIVISLPPVNSDALYISNHAWYHFSQEEGIGLRQLCDWVRYLHIFRSEINHIEMERDLKSFGLWYPWQILEPIAADMLGFPCEECPFYTDRYARQAARVISMTEVDGNFGFLAPSRMKRPEGYIAGKVHSFRRMSNHFGKLFLVSPKKVVSAWSNYVYIGIKQVVTDTLNPLKI